MMFDTWMAMLHNKLKGIENKTDSLKEEVAKDSTVAKESTSQEVKTTIDQVLEKVSSGGDMSTLENMISGYINETGERYVPSWNTPYFLIGSTIDGEEDTSITTETTYTWEAKYAGEIMVAYYGSSQKSSYASSYDILKNTEQIYHGWFDTTGVTANRKKCYFIPVKKGDVITIKINPYASSRPASIRYLIIGYHVESKTTLNIIKSIQQGSVDTTNGEVSIAISPVNPSKSIPFVVGGTISNFNGYELTLSAYVYSNYGNIKNVYWTIVEFY